MMIIIQAWKKIAEATVGVRLRKQNRIQGRWPLQKVMIREQISRCLENFFYIEVMAYRTYWIRSSDGMIIMRRDDRRKLFLLVLVVRFISRQRCAEDPGEPLLPGAPEVLHVVVGPPGQVGLEFVDPAEAAGLAGAGEEAFGSKGAPVAGAVLPHILQEDLILLRHPRPFPHCRPSSSFAAAAAAVLTMTAAASASASATAAATVY